MLKCELEVQALDRELVEEGSIASMKHSEVSTVVPDSGHRDSLSEVLARQCSLSESIIQKNQGVTLLLTHHPETFDGTDITRYHSFVLSLERRPAMQIGCITC